MTANSTPHRLVRWYSPDWLSGYDARVEMDDQVNMTVKDHAVALALIGDLSTPEYDPRDEANAAIVTAIRGRENGVLGKEEMGIEIDSDSREIRLGLGLPKMQNLEPVVRRIEMSTIHGGKWPMFSEARVSMEGDRPIMSWIDPRMLRAHPLNSRKFQSVAVDLTSVAAMSCSLSVPIALRGIAWLRSKCRTGLGRLVHNYGRTGLVVLVPLGRVKSALGLSMPKFSPSYFAKHWDRIKSDCKMIGIGVEFEWILVGKSVSALRLTLNNLGVYSSASPVFVKQERKRAPGRPFKVAPAAPPSPKRKYVRKAPYVKPVKQPVVVASAAYGDDSEGFDY